MKIIDEKGRLFGKINIVDFLIIVLILIVIPAFLHIYKIMGERPVLVPYKWIKAEAVTFTIPEIAKLIKEGDASYDYYGTMDARLIRIIKKDKGYGDKLKSTLIKKSDGIPPKHTIPVFLEVQLLCTQTSENMPYYFRQNAIFAGLEKSRGFIFYTDKYSTFCYILKIEDS